MLEFSPHLGWEFTHPSPPEENSSPHSPTYRCPYPASMPARPASSPAPPPRPPSYPVGVPACPSAYPAAADEPRDVRVVCGCRAPI
ncbi:hypothetical protein GUJ93_ZPchr0009g954 [Zizania palustris]|uniref:Uncharacterized protein n=1 Tax=Zizania palustris TaxID=103762 RepID=A0A8J5RSQ9_ZIZPA|nr:hypothetical protein GUJ93_ZPchr0009g954 [Zizania palustris]